MNIRNARGGVFMSRPSMFSKDYEQQMKRRRVNIVLFILIVIFGVFFGVRYFMGGDGGSLFKNIYNAVIPKSTDKNIEPPAKENDSEKPQAETQENDAQEDQELYYEYKSADGRIYTIEYIIKDGIKTITGFDDSRSGATYDISPDSKSIVFDDIASDDIMLMNSEGQIKKISPDSYKSKSANILIQKQQVLKTKPAYIWARKPHFTSDGRIVYLTDLPYLTQDGKLFLWNASASGGMTKMAGEFATQDIDKITYEGFDESGKLKIGFNSKLYYLAPNSYKVTK
jgi:hypothetical protein